PGKRVPSASPVTRREPGFLDSATTVDALDARTALRARSRAPRRRGTRPPSCRTRTFRAGPRALREAGCQRPWSAWSRLRVWLTHVHRWRFGPRDDRPQLRRPLFRARAEASRRDVYRRSRNPYDPPKPAPCRDGHWSVAFDREDLARRAR